MTPRTRERAGPAAEFLDAATVQRLGAVRETIRSWNWRADPELVAELARLQQLFASLDDAPAATARRHHAGRWVAAVAALLAVAAGITWGATGRAPHPAPHTAAPAPARHHRPVARAQYVAAMTQSTEAGVEVTGGLEGLHGVPTVPAVAGVVLPYAQALQRFQIELANIHWPAAAASAGPALVGDVAGLVTFINTINDTPPLGLGAFLHTFTARTAALQAVVGEVAGDVGITART